LLAPKVMASDEIGKAPPGNGIAVPPDFIEAL
jgi:hypothetical protein